MGIDVVLPAALVGVAGAVLGAAVLGRRRTDDDELRGLGRPERTERSSRSR